MRKINKSSKRPARGGSTVDAPEPSAFDEVLQLINVARARAVAAVNTALIDLYWQIGEHISRRIVKDGWARGPSRNLPNTSGFGNRMHGGFQVKILGVCGKCTRPTATNQFSQHC